MHEPDLQTLTARVPLELDGMRLDQVLASLFEDYSRSRLQQWIKAGQVRVDQVILRPKDKVFADQELTVNIESQDETQAEAQNIPLDIVYEDQVMIVVNKPPGLVVHPAAGNRDGTLVNALLHHAPELREIPRAGVIHRLDKDTSGLLVIARTLSAHKFLVEQLADRLFEREYLAVVQGVMTAGGTVEAPIGRHKVQRKRMAVVPSGKPAITHYRVLERYRAHTAVRVKLETGRTHQIRVHMAYIHFPLVGDPVYGGRLKIPRSCGQGLEQALRNFRRQALHAQHLGLTHPVTKDFIEWHVEPPQDLQQLLVALRGDMERATS